MNFDTTSLLHPNVDVFLTFDSSVLMFGHDLIHLASQALKPNSAIKIQKELELSVTFLTTR